MCALSYFYKIKYSYHSVRSVVQSNYCEVTPIYIDLTERPLTNKYVDASTYDSEYVAIYFTVSHIKNIIEYISLEGYTVNPAKYVHDKKQGLLSFNSNY